MTAHVQGVSTSRRVPHDATIIRGAPAPLPALVERRRSSILAMRFPAAVPFGLLTAWLAYDLLLLCRFVGLDQPPVYAAWTLLTGGLFWLLTLPRRGGVQAGLTLGTLLACVGIATLLLMLGGEGRFFYANPDWQVRDAVLRDMTIHPWPFVYASGDMLRAPIGMYLVPALVGKSWGQAGADLALLFQNGVLLGLLLAIGSTLFASARARLIALTVFLAFSGLDVIGQLKAGNAAGLAPTAHLEGWGSTQFSSTITLAFWVPQHAIAGWIAAIGILLWRVDRLSLGALLMLQPLIALWSPFAVMGAAPFLLYAAWRDLARGRIRAADIALPLVATVIALPALLYMSAAGDRVGFRLFPIAPADYLLFETLEALPFLLIAAAGRQARFGGPILGITAACLLFMPFVQVGWWIDFAMRASIPALAILALHLADGLSGVWPASARRKAALAGLLAVGSVTGLTEIGRAVTFPISPEPRCGFSRAWDETFAAWPKHSYLAPADALPALVRPPSPTPIAADEPDACFDGQWPLPPLF